MATRVPVLLEGGPCDGVKTTAVRTGDLIDAVTCRHVNYQPTARVTKDGRVVYTTAASQRVDVPPSAASVAKPIKAHAAWHGLLVALFVDGPKQLARAGDARHAMRNLKTRRGLR